MDNNFVNLMAPDAYDTTRDRNSMLPNADKGVLVTFFEYNHYMGYKSKIEGRPIYEPRTYIRKIADSKSDFCRPMRESDKLKYPQQWAAYEANQSSHGIVGTLLNDYAKASGNLSAGELENLRSNRVYTVEQLAEISDERISEIGGHARKNRTDAAVWLEKLKGGAVERELLDKIDKLDAQYKTEIQSLKAAKTADPEEVQNLKEANDALADMNKELLKQYEELAEKVAKLEKKKK